MLDIMVCNNLVRAKENENILVCSPCDAKVCRYTLNTVHCTVALNRVPISETTVTMLHKKLVETGNKISNAIVEVGSRRS